MAIKLTGITFITTYNCNAHCEHCFFDTKGENVYMNPELIDLVYKDLANSNTMFWNHFSGGEVLLHKSTFIEIIKKTRSYFKGDIGISTNAFWANNINRAEAVVSELISAGVSGIAISCDYFHEKFIPKENAKNAVRAITNLGLKTHCYIMGARCNSGVYNAEQINLVSQNLAIDVRENSQMPLAPTIIRSIGKGSQINIPKSSKVPQGMCSDLSECLGKRGPFNPAMVWVDAYGNVMLCYGIVIGNVYNTPFIDIINNYSLENSEITKCISVGGPKELLKLVNKNNISMELKFYDECDVCFNARKVLQPYYSELHPRECYP